MCTNYEADIDERARGTDEWLKEHYEPLEGVVARQMYPDRVGFVGRLDHKGALVGDAMRWGFPPVGSSLVVNVRNPERPFWRPWLSAEHRCLVIATRFAEWSPGPPRGPRWFVTTDEPVFAMAGIWRPWKGVRGTKANPVDGEHKLFAFLTTEPNDIVAPIHPKAMPVILQRKDWDQWLTGSEEEALELQRPLPDRLLRLL